TASSTRVRERSMLRVSVENAAAHASSFKARSSRIIVVGAVLCDTRAGRNGSTVATLQEARMSSPSRYAPRGVIPAVVLPFHEDLSIDEQSFRKHLHDVAQTRGLSAITVNAHASEVASCTFDEQRRVLELAREELSHRLALINGVYADGSLEAARIA